MFFKSYSYSLLWALLILTVCGVNGNYIPQIHFTDIIQPDSFAHMILFGVLTRLIAIDRKKVFAGTKSISKLIAPAFFISAVYGVIIEILQATVFVNRSYDYMDMLANTIGCSLATLLVFIKSKVNRF